jgi:hypothetical protein
VTTEPAEAEPVPLATAGWTLELRGDELADVRYLDVPLLRALRFVVRDRDWRTIAPQRTALDVTERDGALQAVLAVRHRDGDVDLAWSGALLLQPGSLTFRVRAEAQSTFRRNRIGLVVLHPLTDADREFAVTGPDGAVRAVRLPERISPHQPLHDIRALTWSTGGLTAHLGLTGEVFETEDQRNWTDASFKTYSTPLQLPFPVTVRPGEVIEQSATLTVRGRPGARITERPAPGVIRLGDPVVRLPPIALTCPAGEAAPAVRAPDVAHVLLFEVDLRRGDLPGRLAAAERRAAALGGVPLDVRLVTDSATDVRAAVDVLALQATGSLTRLGVFHSGTHITEPALWAALVVAADRKLPGVPLVGGSRAHFTELNRAIDRLPADLPELTFSVTPQMHAIERAHVTETLPVQRTVVRNALRLAAGRPLHIGPITLRPRFNAVATTPGHPVVPGTAESETEHTDPRQHGGFAAAWLLGSVAMLSVPGVASLTCFETNGPRGIHTADGALDPAGRLLAQLAPLAGAPVRAVSGDLPAGVHLLAVDSGPGTVLLAANLTRSHQTIRLAQAGTDPVALQVPPDTVQRSTVPLTG